MSEKTLQMIYRVGITIVFIPNLYFAIHGEIFNIIATAFIAKMAYGMEKKYLAYMKNKKEMEERMF